LGNLVTGKSKAVPVLNQAPCHEDVEVQLCVFLTPVLDGSECSASWPSRFTPGEGWRI